MLCFRMSRTRLAKLRTVLRATRVLDVHGFLANSAHYAIRRIKVLLPSNHIGMVAALRAAIRN